MISSRPWQNCVSWLSGWIHIYFCPGGYVRVQFRRGCFPSTDTPFAIPHRGSRFPFCTDFSLLAPVLLLVGILKFGCYGYGFGAWSPEATHLLTGDLGCQVPLMFCKTSETGLVPVHASATLHCKYSLAISDHAGTIYLSKS